jgi:molybdopterin converting factor small subunit
MIQIEIQFFAWQEMVLGRNEEAPVTLKELLNENATFEDLIDHLSRKHPALQGALLDPVSQRLHDNVIVSLNDVFLDIVGGIETHLKDGDRVKIMPFLGGG